MSYDIVAFVLLSLAALVVAGAIGYRSRGWMTPGIVIGAVLMRVVGSFLRYEVLFRYYRGVGDARHYYETGLSYAQTVWKGEPIFLQPAFWLGGGFSWWGSEFVRKVSGLVLSFVGPSMRAEFLAFALLGFIGLWAVCESQYRLAGPAAARTLAWWVWLWPSLWFWPSSVGKEALATLAVGLCALGYVGRSGRVAWRLLLPGLALAFCVRPHVGVLLLAATGVAHWLGPWRAWDLRRVAEGGALAGLAVVAFLGMIDLFRLGEPDLEGVQELVEWRSQQTLDGGSRMESAPLSSGGVWQALINFTLRPFLWEAHNVMALLAAVEVALLPVLAIYYRRSLVFTLRNFRRHRLVRFGLPFVVGYALTIGMTFGNLGLLARQRSIAFPFGILLMVAATERTWSYRGRRARLRRDSAVGAPRQPVAP